MDSSKSGWTEIAMGKNLVDLFQTSLNALLLTRVQYKGILGFDVKGEGVASHLRLPPSYFYCSIPTLNCVQVQ